MKNDPQTKSENDELRDLLKKFLGRYYLPDEALFFAMQWARRGDWEPLAVYIELGLSLSDEARDFLVAVLRGKTKPNNRAQTSVVQVKSAFRAHFVFAEQERGEKRDRAIKRAADEFGVDRRTIQRDLKEWPEAEFNATEWLDPKPVRDLKAWPRLECDAEEWLDPKPVRRR
jgi:hypothetical protein